MPLHGFSPTLKGKEIIPSSVDLSSLAPLWCNHPSSCTEVNCLMLLAFYFSLPSSLCLIFPFKRVPSCLLIWIIMAPLPFFAEFRDGSHGLNTKTLFHGTPTMHLWLPCYAWTTDADPQRDSRAASEGLVDFGVLGVWPPFLALPSCHQTSHGTENLVLTKTVSI